MDPHDDSAERGEDDIGGSGNGGSEDDISACAGGGGAPPPPPPPRKEILARVTRRAARYPQDQICEGLESLEPGADDQDS